MQFLSVRAFLANSPVVAGLPFFALGLRLLRPAASVSVALVLALVMQVAGRAICPRGPVWLDPLVLILFTYSLYGCTMLL